MGRISDCDDFKKALDKAEGMCPDAVRLVCVFALNDARGDDETMEARLKVIRERVNGAYGEAYRNIYDYAANNMDCGVIYG